MNIREEILKLSSAAPVFKDQEDDFDYDETKAKIDSKSNEFNDDFDNNNINDNRRIRPAMADLSEYGKRYKGKKVSRKLVETFQDSEIEEEENDEEEDEDEDEEDEEDEEEEDDDDDDDELDETNEDEDEEEIKTKKITKNSSSTEETIKIFSDRDDELEKGKVVRNQLHLWEMLLETRVKLQNILNIVNTFPQNKTYENIFQSLKPEVKATTKEIIQENNTYLSQTFNQIAEIQQKLFQTDPDAHYMLEQTGQKRKRSESSDDEEDDDDEEIYSDTDEENQANERKKLKISNKKPIEFKSIKHDQFESYLEKINKNFHKYRNATIQKWYDKTRLVTTKSFQSFEKPILQQIDHLLMDKERLIKRTQLKRSLYSICGNKNEEFDGENNETLKVDDLKDRHLKDHDEEIFDDQDFYNQLMRELIDRQTSSVLDPVELSRKSIELQKLRNKNKKKVDTKASKGRKIKFVPHKPLINFMAPINRLKMSEEARGELFRSLFADHIKLLTSSNSNGNEHLKNNDDIDFNCLFKSIK